MKTAQSFVAAGAEYEFVSAPEAPFKMPDVPVWRVPAREFPITDYGAVTGAVNAVSGEYQLELVIFKKDFFGMG